MPSSASAWAILGPTHLVYRWSRSHQISCESPAWLTGNSYHHLVGSLCRLEQRVIVCDSLGRFWCPPLSLPPWQTQDCFGPSWCPKTKCYILFRTGQLNGSLSCYFYGSLDFDRELRSSPMAPPRYHYTNLVTRSHSCLVCQMFFSWVSQRSLSHHHGAPGIYWTARNRSVRGSRSWYLQSRCTWKWRTWESHLSSPVQSSPAPGK